MGGSSPKTLDEWIKVKKKYEAKLTGQQKFDYWVQWARAKNICADEDLDCLVNIVDELSLDSYREGSEESDEGFT